MIEIINPFTTKIIMTMKDGDSVRAISRRIGVSYGWTYYWIERLERYGVLKRRKQSITVNTKNELYKDYLGFIRKSLAKNLRLEDAYSLPALSVLEYAFTRTDAVFIWTKGGYNIGRSRESYPIFIEVLRKDLDKWAGFFDKFGARHERAIRRKRGIYFILSAKDEIEKEEISGAAVIPLKKTVEWAKKYIYNFQPALEMLDEMYNLKLGVKYIG